jgi:hypothetical protein
MHTQTKTDKGRGKPELPMKHITIGKSFLSQGPSPREQREAMEKRLAESRQAEQDDDDGKISRADWRELALSRYERMEHYRQHAERLAAIAQSVIDEAKDGLDRSAWRLQQSREALAQWEGAK